MSDEERRDSLADQAAAWVPPWERPRPAAPTTPEAASAPAEVPGADEPAEPPPTTAPVEAAETAESAESAEFLETADTVLTAPAAETTESAESVPTAPTAEVSEAVGPVEQAAAAESAVAASTVEPVPAAPTEASGAVQAGTRDVPPRQAAGRRRAAVAPEPAPELADAELRGALEAILLVVDEPVGELVLAQVLEQPAERIGPLLDEIAAGYTAAGHGFELRRAAGGWRLYTRPEYATYVERFVLDGQSVRLTQAALETLAVVAYKQPVTRSRISAIRGVNCDGVIRTLVTRGLVEECGTESDSGAFLYRTTTLFLEKLGLNTVDELPPLAPFLPDDVEELADATR
ncbi:SMC-Scp complex subunit ScpB [Micromonospora sp. bgisy143]|uniref:SMC-Scp complex subunit ScpB n=1 Tax=Micromonospora sp. bgisy143 TaxID=3413790 RepID=UPI003EBAC354